MSHQCSDRDLSHCLPADHLAAAGRHADPVPTLDAHTLASVSTSTLDESGCSLSPGRPGALFFLPLRLDRATRSQCEWNDRNDVTQDAINRSMVGSIIVPPVGMSPVSIVHWLALGGCLLLLQLASHEELRGLQFDSRLQLTVGAAVACQCIGC